MGRRQAETTSIRRRKGRLANPFIRDRAIRRCGELLKQIEPGQGARDGKREAGARPPLREDAARESGLSPHQAKQAIRVANVPAEDFERQVESDDGQQRQTVQPRLDVGEVRSSAGPRNSAIAARQVWRVEPRIH